MRAQERFKLHFGPYTAPKYRIGKTLQCAIRGKVPVCAQSNGHIPWPISKVGIGVKMLVICGDLLRALRRESVQAVAHWWGITPHTVTKWRRRLGIRNNPEGNTRLRRSSFKEPWANRARELAFAHLREASRREKIAAARRGKPRPAHVLEALLKANCGRKLSADHRRKLIEAHNRRGTRP